MEIKVNGNKTSLIKKVIKDKNRVILDGINIQKKHLKPTQKNQEGGIVNKEGSIDASNIMILSDGKEAKATKITYKQIDNKKIRIYKKTGGEIK